MIKIGIVALAALTLAPAASARTNDGAFGKDSAVLTLAGLDLSTAAGQQRLAVRVDQAAREVCGDNLANIHTELEARARVCRADVANQVRTQIEARVAQASRPVQLASR